MVYPRSSGHCASHYISEHIVPYSEDDFPQEIYLNKALMYLQEEGMDLVKGDLVIFGSEHEYSNKGVTIYDGKNIVGLCYDGPYDHGHLPPVFHVIEDDVPINYWEHRNKSCSNPVRGIEHSTMVWFNISTVWVDVLTNIDYGPINNGASSTIDDDGIDHKNIMFEHILPEFGLFTKFRYNNKEYRIIFDYPLFNSIFTDYDPIGVIPEKIESPDTIVQIKDRFKNILRSFILHENCIENVSGEMEFHDIIFGNGGVFRNPSKPSRFDTMGRSYFFSDNDYTLFMS